MHYCYDALIIYGWSEGNRDSIICEEWLDNNNISSHALDIVEHQLGEAVYGLPFPINLATGGPILSATQEHVNEAYRRFKAKFPEHDSPLGFYLAMSGDYDIPQYTYNPDVM
jgi:hypothetical protein